MIRLFLVIILMTSCSVNEPYKGKKIGKLLIDEKLEKLLQEDVSNYINNYQTFFSTDSIFTLILQKEDDIDHLRFYATNGIIDSFQYIGYFYCNNVLFLYRDTGRDKENSLPLIKKSKNDDFEIFS